MPPLGNASEDPLVKHAKLLVKEQANVSASLTKKLFAEKAAGPRYPEYRRSMAESLSWTRSTEGPKPSSPVSVVDCASPEPPATPVEVVLQEPSEVEHIKEPEPVEEPLKETEPVKAPEPVVVESKAPTPSKPTESVNKRLASYLQKSIAGAASAAATTNDTVSRASTEVKSVEKPAPVATPALAATPAPVATPTQVLTPAPAPMQARGPSAAANVVNADYQPEPLKSRRAMEALQALRARQEAGVAAGTFVKPKHPALVRVAEAKAAAKAEAERVAAAAAQPAPKSSLKTPTLEQSNGISPSPPKYQKKKRSSSEDNVKSSSSSSSSKRKSSKSKSSSNDKKTEKKSVSFGNPKGIKRFFGKGK